MDSRKMKVFVAVIAGMAAVLHAAEPEPDKAQWIMSLEKALPWEGPLEVMLDVRDGTVKGAIATARRFNSRPHSIDTSGLTLKKGHLQGGIKVTINPDPWVPRGGKTMAREYSIDAVAKDGAITGKQKGRYGIVAGKDDSGTSVEGTIEGSLRTAPAASEYSRLRMRLFAPLIAMWDYKKSQWPRGTSKYGMDMNLIVSCRDGKKIDGTVILENPFRGKEPFRFTAAVSDGKLTGSMAADVTVFKEPVELKSTISTLVPENVEPDVTHVLKLEEAACARDGKKSHVYVFVKAGDPKKIRTYAIANRVMLSRPLMDVDLKLIDNRLSGTMLVLRRPNRWSHGLVKGGT